MTAGGLDAVEVCDHIQALSVIRTGEVDLVMLALPVDEVAAMDLPAVMRRVSPAAYLPVMILADNPTEQQLCGYLQYGADEIITSRTSAAQMIARTRSLLRVRDLHEQLYQSRATLEDALQRERRLLAKLQSDNAQLQTLATTDPLTHVHNVRAFSDILRHEFSTARRYNCSLGLLVLDVDHFKLVNDTCGHPSGDFVLKELAVILKQSLRDSDVTARTGGEEFSVLLPRASRRQTAQSAERLRAAVAARLFSVYGHDIRVTISIGMACYPADAAATEPDMLFYFADQALLAAKQAGRDRVVSFHHLSRATRGRLQRQYAQAQQPQPREQTVAG